MPSFPFELFFLFATVLFLASLALVIWGVVDAASRSDAAWAAAEQNKVLWIALQAGGFLLGAAGGLVMAIIYLAAIRPKVQAAEHRVDRPNL